MKKRVHALFLAVLMLVTTVLSVWTPVEVKADGGTTVIIHYNRPDGNYADWDVWGWEEGQGGVAYTFDYEDDYGKVCVIQLDKVLDKLNYIVRIPDWSQKDVAEDQFIEIADGFAEVWIESTVAGYKTTSPTGTPAFDLSQIGGSGNGGGNTETTPPAEGQVQVNLHYARYGKDYSGWNVWFWPKGGDGTATQFTGEDDFGKIATYNVDAAAGQLGFIVRLNDWEAKDTDGDRFIDLSKAVNGVVDVWIVESDVTVNYNKDNANLEPKILSASLNTAKTLKLKVTTPVNTDDTASLGLFKVVDEDGKEYAVESLYSKDGVASEFEMNMKEELPLSKMYTVKSDVYGELSVTYGDVYNSEDFEEAFHYDGNDLGPTYSKESTTFKVWSPFAGNVELFLYKNGGKGIGTPYDKIQMTKGDKGVWSATVNGDLNGVFYTYAFTNNGVTTEAVDLYAKATGVNGQRGMVVDLSATNPKNWNEKKPEFKNATDAIVYEMHVRDFTIDESSGVKNKGKYLGLTETGTKNSAGLSTGLDYIKQLGVTHVQLLPVYDYSPNSVDETNLSKPQFNWGYDPYNYNVPEGSYSTDPFDGSVRINEFKQMVQAFHDNDIRVIMDVVYNHTSESANSWFNITVPGYYHRLNANGSYSNGSGCGNEVASERSMVRKYIVDSVVYWASEYNIDGFRFDLMALIDIETMEAVRAALDKVDSTIIVYGEGWTGGGSLLSDYDKSLKKNIVRFEDLQVGAFSDDIRDGIKGSVFSDTDKGFATGKTGQEERIKSGVIGATNYDGISWGLTGTDVSSPWTKHPTQVINYVSAHDNLTLWDKICLSNPDDTEADRIKMNNLSASIVYTAQGIPFMLSGEEILRSKEGDHNSYKSSDEINSIKWDDMNTDVLAYYKGLIEFRKAHAGLRMTTGEDVQQYLKFIDAPSNMVAFTIDGAANGEVSDELLIIYNGNNASQKITIPEGEWKVCIDGTKAGTEVIRTISGGEITVDAISCLALVKGDTGATGKTDGGMEPWVIAVIAVAVVAVIAVVVVVLTSSKKKAAKAAAANETETNKTEE